MMIPFTKGHANGNDFIFVYAKNFPKKYRSKNIIRDICSRHTGIGADGFFIVSIPKKYDFELDYYNCDGSAETFCANGSRCAAQFMYSNKLIAKNTVFIASGNAYEAKILKQQRVSMKMKIPKYKSDRISIEGLNGYFIDSGAKHFVSESKRMGEHFVLSMGKKIRYAPIFAPLGVNVNFYTLQDSHTVNIKTYEKGIEAIMNSCNSGSAAVVFHLAKQGLVTSPVKTVSKGGCLYFSFTALCRDFWVNGPAIILFNGEFNINHISALDI